MSTNARTVTVSADVLSFALCSASEKDAEHLTKSCDGEPTEVLDYLRSGPVTNSLLKASVELFEAEEFNILRSLVAAYSRTLGTRPVTEGGSYALEVIDAFSGFEDGKLSNTYLEGVPDNTRKKLREHLRSETIVECWALVDASDMQKVLQTPWKEITPFLGVSWIDAQKEALAELSSVDWSSRENLHLHNRNAQTLPHESLTEHFYAIGYTIHKDGSHHRGDGNTRANALLAQGASKVLVHHERPFGTYLNGISVSPEIITF